MNDLIFFIQNRMTKQMDTQEKNYAEPFAHHCQIEKNGNARGTHRNARGTRKNARGTT